MFSNFIRISLILMGFSPILFSLWLVGIIQKWDSLHIYVRADSWQDVSHGFFELVKNHYLLLLFGAILLVTGIFMRKAVRTLSIRTLEVKSIKPADNNFLTFLFSIILPFFKLFVSGISDISFLIGFVIVIIVYSVVMNKSYHFNLVLRFFFGYKNYEVQSKKEVTFLMLSKKSLINPNQVTQYVQLTDHMLINVT